MNPNGLLRGDWLLPDGTIVEYPGVEYPGMLGDEDHRTKMTAKADLAAATGTRLITVTPEDRTSLDRLLDPGQA